jgi:hypothetical protein
MDPMQWGQARLTPSDATLPRRTRAGALAAALLALAAWGRLLATPEAASPSDRRVASAAQRPAVSQAMLAAHIEPVFKPPTERPPVEVVGRLLPPQDVPPQELPAEPLPPTPLPPVEPDSVLEGIQSPAPRIPSAAVPPPVFGAPTPPVVAQHATERIRSGYALAERGAYFAAQRELVAALRLIAEAADQTAGAAHCTTALASGLRAMDEAEDFTPRGREQSAELSMSVIVSSHRTPAAKELPVDQLLPQQLADAYFRYAETQLAASVAGEPAGSMALHALGKLSTRLGRTEPDSNPLAARKALALQNAALLARDDNYLAAHELAVLLAESGHLADSERVLEHVVARAPDPVVLRNLAYVQRKLGRPDHAAQSERYATELVARGVEANSIVAWVSADALARTPDALGPATAPTASASTATASTASTSPPAAGAAPLAKPPLTARRTSPLAPLFR